MATPLSTYDDLRARAAARPPRVALVLGSGLGDLADRLADAVALPFAAVPGLGAPTVAGHHGHLLHGTWGGRPVLMFAGRLHHYEGHPWPRVVRPVEVAHELGAAALVTTNAVGGIRPDLAPGTLMAIRAHLDATRPDGWRGPPDATPYAPALRDRLRAAAGRTGVELAEGVYAQVTGPSYETPAEVRALRACGADAVGMSTAREAAAAAARGLATAAVACVTNRAAGLSDGPIHHGEVLATAAALRDRLTRLLAALVADLD